MPGRFQPGDEAIFARLPSSPLAYDPYLFFSNEPTRPYLGSRVIVLGLRDSQPEPLLIVETSSGLRFYASEEMLDRVDDRGALIREYWRSHREDGLRALCANEPFCGMILTGPVAVVADFTDISPPTAGPMVERVEFRLDARMRTRLGPEFWVMCEGDEVEQLSERDVRRRMLSRTAVLRYARARLGIPPEQSIPATPTMVAALQSIIDQEVNNAMYFGSVQQLDSGVPAEREFLELQRGMINTIAGAMGIPASHLFGRDRTSPTDAGNAAAKSMALLKDWLSPAQLEQFERMGSFEVVGGKTGNRYRVHQPGPYNIDVLRANGAVDHQICVEPFHPVERGMYFPVAPGDFLLTQKIALEKDEIATLRVANRRKWPLLRRFRFIVDDVDV